MHVTALIVAAGSGSRMGDGLPKQYRPLGGKAVLAHAVDALAAHPRIGSVRVVIGQGQEQLAETALSGRDVGPLIVGGAERADSVRAGLAAIEGDAILVHDAARPFCPPSVVDRLLTALADDVAAVPALPIADTLATAGGDLGDPVDRSNLVRVQTPQAFRLDSLIDVSLRQRVDIRAQIFRVRAAESEVAIAKAGRLPTVNGSASFGSELVTGAAGSFITQLDERRGGSIGIGVAVPILDRGATSIAKQRAQVQLENELLTLRDVEQSVAIQVRRAYLDYLAAQEQLAASTAQQAAAALALQAAQARYRVGAATFVEVTVARATLIQAQSAVVSARSAVVFQESLMSYYTGVLDPSNVRLDR